MSASEKPFVAHVRHGAVVVEELRVGRAVVERAPNAGIRDEDFIAVVAKLQLVDHDRVEQTDDVRAGAHLVAGIAERFLERARTTELVARFEDEHRLARAREVRRGGEPVVPTADDDCVPCSRRELAHRHRQSDATKGRVDRTGRHRAKRKARAKDSRFATNRLASATVCCAEIVHCSHLPHGGR